MICLCGHPYLSHESGECTEKGCPCVKWEEVAEGPIYYGIDVSESPDVSVTTLINTETGEFTRLTDPPVSGTIGAIAEKVYDPTWMDEMPVFEMGRGFTTFGEMRTRTTG